MNDEPKTEEMTAEERNDKRKIEIEERKRKRKSKKNRTLIIIIAVLVFSTAFTLYLNIDNPLLHNMFSGIGFDASTDGALIEFEKTEDFDVSSFNGNAIVARNTQVICVDSDMKHRWEIQQNNAAPVIKTGGKYTLTYSFDVANAVLSKDGGDVIELVTEASVIGGSVNENGYCAVVTREKGYKAQIIVYSPKGEVIYKWHSADNYIIDVAVSPDNRSLAAATADFSTDVASGGLMMFNFAQEKPYAGQILENNLILEIRFTGKNSLLAVGDIGIAVFDALGEKQGEYSYDGKKLTNYDIGTNDNIVLALNESDSVLNDTEIKILSKNLKEKGTCTVSGAVSCIDSVDGKVLVVADRKLSLFSERGNEIKKLDVNKDIKKAVLFGNGDDALIVSGSVAETVRLK